jgi:hypothetical protein
MECKNALKRCFTIAQIFILWVLFYFVSALFCNIMVQFLDLSVTTKV